MVNISATKTQLIVVTLGSRARLLRLMSGDIEKETSDDGLACINIQYGNFHGSLPGGATYRISAKNTYTGVCIQCIFQHGCLSNLKVDTNAIIQNERFCAVAIQVS